MDACREVGAGVWLHVDDRDLVVGVEVFNLATRGGIHVEDLDESAETEVLAPGERSLEMINVKAETALKGGPSESCWAHAA